MPESRLNEFTDWEGPAQSCSCSGLQLPRDSPIPSFAAGPSVHPLPGNGVPHSVQNQLQGEREVSGFSEHKGPPGSPGSPSTHMQSSKHLLLRPRLWGVQRCSRRSQQVPANTASTHGQPSCVDPPCHAAHGPTGQEIHHLCGRAMPQ